MAHLAIDVFDAPKGVRSTKLTLTLDDGAVYRIFNLAKDAAGEWREVVDGSETRRIFASHAGIRWPYKFKDGERREMVGREVALVHQLEDAFAAVSSRARDLWREPAKGLANGIPVYFDRSGGCWRIIDGDYDTELALANDRPPTGTEPFRYFVRKRPGAAPIVLCYTFYADEQHTLELDALARQHGNASILSPQTGAQAQDLVLMNPGRFMPEPVTRGDRSFAYFRDKAQR